jgi:hypothetical protein
LNTVQRQGYGGRGTHPKGADMRRKLPLLSVVTAIVLIGALAIGVPSFAGDGSAKGDDEGPLSLTPWKTFSTSKDGGTSVVVSSDGNVLYFTSPSGSQHIYGALEGYILCYSGPSAYVNAYDLGGSEAGFGSSTQGTSNVLRSTADGVLSLNQAFTFSAANKSLQIAVTIKNLTGSMVTDIKLRRQVDFDIGNDAPDDWHAETADSYFAWEANAHGMVRAPTAVPKPDSFTHHGRDHEHR